MIRFSKMCFKTWILVLVKGIKCNFINVAKVTSIFKFNYAVITIDSLPLESSFVAFIEERGLECIISRNTTEYAEVSVKVPCNLVNFVLEEAIMEDPENIFMFNLINLTNWREQSSCYHEVLISRGVSDVFIGIARDENVLSVCVSKGLFSPDELYRKIKAINYK